MPLRHLAWLLAALLSFPFPAGAQQHVDRVLSLRIDAKGRLFEGEHIHISRDTLIRDLKNGLHDGPYDVVLISASPATQYGRVAEILHLVEQYGPGIRVSVNQK